MAEKDTATTISEQMIIISHSSDLTDLLIAIKVINGTILNQELNEAEVTVFTYVANHLLRIALDQTAGGQIDISPDHQPSLFGQVPY